MASESLGFDGGRDSDDADSFSRNFFDINAWERTSDREFGSSPVFGFGEERYRRSTDDGMYGQSRHRRNFSDYGFGSRGGGLSVLHLDGDVSGFSGSRLSVGGGGREYSGGYGSDGQSHDGGDGVRGPRRDPRGSRRDPRGRGYDGHHPWGVELCMGFIRNIPMYLRVRFPGLGAGFGTGLGVGLGAGLVLASFLLRR